MPDLVQFLHSKFEHTPTAGQARFLSMFATFALNQSKEKKAFVLKGYAGTGKTTIVKTLVNSLSSFNIRCILMAPTGRAAKVLASYTGRRAHTIHRLIYMHKRDPDTGAYVMKLVQNRAKNTLYIVDESSMIHDASYGQRSLLQDLFAYVYSDTSNKVLLIGDTAQLPPVGKPESPGLNDELIRFNFGLEVTAMELSEVIRQEEGSGILYNATQIRSNIASGEDAVQFRTRGYSDIFSMTPDRFEDGIRYAYDKFGMENSIIICRANWQAVQYNQYIRRNILYYDEELVPGDVLMVVKNNYTWLEPDSEAGFIANGDFCEIRKVKTYDELYDVRYAVLEIQMIDYPEMAPIEVRVILDTLYSNKPAMDVDESKALYDKIVEDYAHDMSRIELKKELETNEHLHALQVKFAYALTCHKAQGGQWDCVFIDQGNKPPESDKETLRWQYTAVTRAKKELYLVSYPKPSAD